jgi:autotransporter-associated beta strand protein
VNVSAQGYSGQSIWSRIGGGGWGSFESWDVPGGLPGVDGSLSVEDTATFGSGPTGTTTVLLDGASPQLASLTFETAAASYTIAPGSGGSLTVGTPAATGSLAVTAGSHTISTGLGLGRDTTVATAAGTRLTLDGALSGSNTLTKSGLGELLVTGTGGLSGATTVVAGTLRVNGSIASSAVTVQSGATLAGSGSIGPLTIAAGGTLSPGNSPGIITVDGDAIWQPGGSYNWQIHDAGGIPGTGWDLTNIAGDLDLRNLSSLDRFNINLWSLAEIEPDVNGGAIRFDPTQAFSWTIASVAAGKSILGFSADHFNLMLEPANGTSGFANSLAGGSFSIMQNGQDLNLVFVPVPEPGWVALLLAGAGLGYGIRRRRSRGGVAAGGR